MTLQDWIYPVYSKTRRLLVTASYVCVFQQGAGAYSVRHVPGPRPAAPHGRLQLPHTGRRGRAQ